VWTWDDWRSQAHHRDVDGRAVAFYDLGPAGSTALTFLHG
jgi:hypothetical protein